MFNTYLNEFVVYPNQTTNQTVFTLLDIPDLKDAAIFGLEVYTSSDIPKSPQGNNVINSDVMQKAFLRLYVEDCSGMRGVGTYIRNLPFVNMHNVQNSNADPFERFPFDMQGQKVYWDKCEIFLGAPIGTLTDNVSFLININYKFTTKA